MCCSIHNRLYGITTVLLVEPLLSLTECESSCTPVVVPTTVFTKLRCMLLCQKYKEWHSVSQLTYEEEYFKETSIFSSSGWLILPKKPHYVDVYSISCGQFPHFATTANGAVLPMIRRRRIHLYETGICCGIL